jgi:hypothetical protein
LLLPDAPEVGSRHKCALDLLERWLERTGEDDTVPPTIPAAVRTLGDNVTMLRNLARSASD